MVGLHLAMRVSELFQGFLATTLILISMVGLITRSLELRAFEPMLLKVVGRTRYFCLETFSRLSLAGISYGSVIDESEMHSCHHCIW